MTSLPTHRHVLTTLINTLSSASSPPSTAEPPTNPLHGLSQNHLLTLHVLFPNLLLPAFDLLDRRLVTRLTLANESASESDRGDGSGAFLVKSLATTLTRRHRDVGLSAQRYLVQLGTWQCACPSFAFDAFPVSASEPGPQADETEWSFGGISLDGDVPCCKHLLACLLIEKWSGMLGGYVEERTVSREEMAGIIADM